MLQSQASQQKQHAPGRRMKCLQQRSCGFQPTPFLQALVRQRAGSVPALRLPPQPCRTGGSGLARLQTEPRCAPSLLRPLFKCVFCCACGCEWFVPRGKPRCLLRGLGLLPLLPPAAPDALSAQSHFAGISANMMLLCCFEHSKALLFLCQNKGALHCVNLP